MEVLHAFFEKIPMAALFLSLSLGYLVGKLKIGKFQLGGMTGTLLAAVAIGQVGVPVDPVVKQMMFALFIFTTGYVCGPQFFVSLNRKTLDQLHLAVFSGIVVFVVIWGLAQLLDFDKGMAAGMLAGATTESASIGTASEALQRLGLAADELEKLEANIGVSYALTYLFGMTAVMIFASRVAPRLLGIDLKKEAQALEAEMGGSGIKLGPGQFEAFGKFRAHAYIVEEADAVGVTVGDLEARFNVKVMQAAHLDKRIDVSPDLDLQTGYRLALQGEHGQVLQAGQFVGRETANVSALGFINEERDVVVTNKALRGKTLAEAREIFDLEGRYGVQVPRMLRLDQEITMYPQTEILMGDVVQLVGEAGDVAHAADEIGYTQVASSFVDHVYLGCGMMVGILMGLVTVPVAGVPIGLGIGGGCLVSGLIFGWLRAKKPTFGNLPAPTAKYLQEFGLAVFIASVGLATGPQAIVQILQHGLTLPVVGIVVALVPCIAQVYYGRYVLKMNPVVVCGAITGNLTSTPALNMVIDAAESGTPVMGYTVSYAVSNVILTFLGPVLVFAV
jgi:putative transport protein